MEKPAIRILSNLARAGGTLVSKCMGAMDGTVLLSEIHPRTTHIFDPVTQIQDWYPYLGPLELPDTLSFVQIIQRIASRCEQHNTTLILRDWAHLDFIGHPFISDPPFRLQLTETLASAFEIVQCALVRHPVNQWVSTSSLTVMQGQLELDTFLAGYRRFAEQSIKTGFIRFEDFTREPTLQMQSLCNHLDISFDPGFVNHWQENKRVTGNTSGTSRGSTFNEIKPLAHHAVEAALMERFRNNKDYHLAIELLGYTDLDSDRISSHG